MYSFLIAVTNILQNPIAHMIVVIKPFLERGIYPYDPLAIDKYSTEIEVSKGIVSIAQEHREDLSNDLQIFSLLSVC